MEGMHGIEPKANARSTTIKSEQDLQNNMHQHQKENQRQQQGTHCIRTDSFRVEVIEDKGRGVVADRVIRRGEEIERSPCISCPAEEYAAHGKHTIFDHYFYSGKSGTQYLPLGIGCLFNHSEQPNVDFRLDETRNEIRYYAAREIAEGEELCIYYGANLWFNNAEEDEDEEYSEDEQELALPMFGLGIDDFPQPAETDGNTEAKQE